MKLKFWCGPGGDGPPLHYHPFQSESFEVMSGELSVTRDGEKRILKKGEKFAARQILLINGRMSEVKR